MLPLFLTVLGGCAAEEPPGEADPARKAGGWQRAPVPAIREERWSRGGPNPSRSLQGWPDRYFGQPAVVPPTRVR